MNEYDKQRAFQRGLRDGRPSGGEITRAIDASWALWTFAAGLFIVAMNTCQMVGEIHSLVPAKPVHAETAK